MHARFPVLAAAIHAVAGAGFLMSRAIRSQADGLEGRWATEKEANGTQSTYAFSGNGFEITSRTPFVGASEFSTMIVGSQGMKFRFDSADQLRLMSPTDNTTFLKRIR